MVRRYIFPLLLLALSISTVTEAQVFIGGGWGGGYRPRPRRPPMEDLPEFKPTLNFSIGYGFPALDKMYLPQYYNSYQGNISQTGPITAALDYQFARSLSIGIIATYNSVSAPYYDYNTSTPDFTAKLTTWSFMFDLVRYFPVNSTVVSPYIRTAIGINAWTQSYKDPSGNNAAVAPVDLPDLAYQVGIGAKFYVAQNAGFFVEAGYGKYILHGGLTFKF